MARSEASAAETLPVCVASPIIAGRVGPSGYPRAGGESDGRLNRTRSLLSKNIDRPERVAIDALSSALETENGSASRVLKKGP
jgi:hypothetical protein